MVKSAESVVVSRSVADVFAYVADLRNEPTWHVDIASVPDADPIPVVARTYAVKFQPFMGKTDGTFTAVEVVPDSRIVYQANFAGFAPKITYEVSAVDGGTRFTRAVEMQAEGLMRLMTPMMALMVPRRNKVFVGNLKRVLEA